MAEDEMGAEEFGSDTDGEEVDESEYGEGIEEGNFEEESEDLGGPNLGGGGPAAGPSNIDLTKMMSQAVAIGLPPGEQAEATKKFKMWAEPVAKMFDIDDAFNQVSGNMETHLSPGKKLALGVGSMGIIALAIRKGGDLPSPSKMGGMGGGRDEAAPPPNASEGSSEPEGNPEGDEEDVPDWMK